jgi:hypothetical protein
LRITSTIEIDAVRKELVTQIISEIQKMYGYVAYCNIKTIPTSKKQDINDDRYVDLELGCVDNKPDLGITIQNI